MEAESHPASHVELCSILSKIAWRTDAEFTGRKVLVGVSWVCSLDNGSLNSSGSVVLLVVQATHTGRDRSFQTAPPENKEQVSSLWPILGAVWREKTLPQHRGLSRGNCINAHPSSF